MIAEIKNAIYMSRLEVIHYFLESADVSMYIREYGYLLHSSSFRSAGQRTGAKLRHCKLSTCTDIAPNQYLNLFITILRGKLQPAHGACPALHLRGISLPARRLFGGSDWLSRQPNQELFRIYRTF